jgi:aspartokinase/homoserine dehydrogenase 1
MTHSNWLVYKFGGTSMGSAERIAEVARIVTQTHFSSPGQRKKDGKLATVVSAMSGVTNSLLNLIELATQRSPLLPTKMEELRTKHAETARALLPADVAGEFARKLGDDLRAIADVLKAVGVMRECSDRIRDFVSGHGELWSATILAEYLKAQGYSCAFVDAREVLIVEPETPSPVIQWKESEEAFEKYRDTSLDMLVITGFICRTRNDVPATLGRNGSDYSAAIFGRLLDSSEIVIWTDVDGVLSADPRRVSDAVVIPELSYREAVDLAHFGAKVIHPMTMIPAVDKGIPIIIKNTFRPDFEGSRISATSNCDQQFPVKGCTTVDNVTTLAVEIAGLQSLTNVTARMFTALADQRVNVIMSTIGSPGNAISIAVPNAQAAVARSAIEKALSTERQNGEVRPIEEHKNNAILAIAGDGMKGHFSLAAQFMAAMAKTEVNIRSIAQGPSERNISIVIDSADANRALRAAHAGFYLSPQTLSIGVIGTGKVASSLLTELGRVGANLKKNVQCDFRVRGIINSHNMILAEKEISLGTWGAELKSKGTTANLDSFIDHINTPGIPHTVIVDCTDSSEIAAHHPEWLAKGIHIITPNRHGNAGSTQLYQTLQSEMRAHKKHYLYSTTLCGALPIIETLADLIQTGEDVVTVEGVLSGTLSQIFSLMNEGVLFSQACATISEQGTPISALRTELAGLEVAQKALILGRELNITQELSDVKSEDLAPESAKQCSDGEFLNSLKAMDETFAKRIRDAKQNNETLCYVGSVNAPRNSIFVGVKAFPQEHAFANLKVGENAVSFQTIRSFERPLVIRGAGGAVKSVAAGLFAELLRLTRYLGSMG